MTRRPWVVVLGLVGLLCSSSPADAQDRTEQARRHFEAGTQAFETGDYERAMAEFRQAHELTDHPDLLYNIYSSAERSGQLQDAASALERYLAEGRVEASDRAALEQRLTRLRQRIAARTSEPGEPEPRPVLDRSAEAPASAPSSSGGPHPAAIGTLVGAGVLTVAFGILATISEVEDEALAQSCGSASGRTCTDAEVSTLRALNTAADVSWIGAAVTGVVGLVLLFALPAEAGPSTQTAVAPWASPDGGGVVAVGRW